MYNPFSLEGKTILVTGASSGIGKTIALECAKMNAKLIITGRDQTRLEKVFNQLEGIGHQKIILDINNHADVDTFIDTIINIDGLVHSAGIVQTLPFKFVRREDFDNVMNTNFFSPAFITNKLIRLKKIKKGGSILFISSLAGNYIANPGTSMYSASKGAINALSKVLAIELSSQKIRVNCLQPGMVQTEMIDTFQKSITEDQLKEDQKKYPLGYGQPEDIAFSAIYFLSDASKWVTGVSLILDGGFLLQ